VNITENQNDMWKLYPNPVNQLLQVENNELTATKFVIYNALGEIVLKGNLNFGKNEISTDQLIQGVYHIEFYDLTSSLGRVKVIKMDTDF
jgi:hypothetical protein